MVHEPPQVLKVAGTEHLLLEVLQVLRRRLGLLLLGLQGRELLGEGQVGGVGNGGRLGDAGVGGDRVKVACGLLLAVLLMMVWIKITVKFEKTDAK